MNSKHIKIITVTLSLLIFSISLTQNAFEAVFSDQNHLPALQGFLAGSIIFLGGGALEQLVWMANPLCLFAIIKLLKGEKKAINLSIVALVLSGSFFFWDQVLRSESGAQTKIIKLESGYYLWVLSIAVLTLGSFFYFRNKEQEQKTIE